MNSRTDGSPRPFCFNRIIATSFSFTKRADSYGRDKIEKLQAREEIPSEETLKHIRALIDYHDYVKSRRNSTFDIQTGLNFLNSLVFPVIGFLLGNRKEILDFFSK